MVTRSQEADCEQCQKNAVRGGGSGHGSGHSLNKFRVFPCFGFSQLSSPTRHVH
jgi:hypothetical protein